MSSLFRGRKYLECKRTLPPYFCVSSFISSYIVLLLWFDLRPHLPYKIFPSSFPGHLLLISSRYSDRLRPRHVRLLTTRFQNSVPIGTTHTGDSGSFGVPTLSLPSPFTRPSTPTPIWWALKCKFLELKQRPTQLFGNLPKKIVFSLC